MKKFFIFAIVLAVFGCSNNDEVIDNGQSAGKLVDAEIGVSMGESKTTRAYLGEVTQEDGDEFYTIVHKFQTNDQMYITDYLGQHSFTLTSSGHSAKIKGKWAEIDNDAVKNGILATFPLSAVTKKVTVSQNKPTMYFNLSTEQTSYVNNSGTTPQLSYDRSAGLAFACANNKVDALWFLPVVSYLYFYSKESTCTVNSSVGIAGNYEVTYSGQYGTGTNTSTIDYGTAEGLKQFLTYTADAKTITCHGKHIDGHKNKFDAGAPDYFEYIIAVKPGLYTEKSLWVTANGASKSLYCPANMELIPSELYFIGCVDEEPAQLAP